MTSVGTIADAARTSARATLFVEGEVDYLAAGDGFAILTRRLETPEPCRLHGAACEVLIESRMLPGHGSSRYDASTSVDLHADVDRNRCFDARPDACRDKRR